MPGSPPRRVQKVVEHELGQGRDPGLEVYGKLDQLLATGREAPAAILLGEAIEAGLKGLDPLESAVLRLQLNGYTIRELVDVVLANLQPPDPQVFALRLQGWSMPVGLPLRRTPATACEADVPPGSLVSATLRPVLRPPGCGSARDARSVPQLPSPPKDAHRILFYRFFVPGSAGIRLMSMEGIRRAVLQ